MRKLTLALILMALILAFAVVPAFARVHPVSQAACSGNSNAGGSNASSSAPSGVIPTTASGGSLPNDGGGDGDPTCDVKD